MSALRPSDRHTAGPASSRSSWQGVSQGTVVEDQTLIEPAGPRAQVDDHRVWLFAHTSPSKSVSRDRVRSVVGPGLGVSSRGVMSDSADGETSGQRVKFVGSLPTDPDDLVWAERDGSKRDKR